MKTGTKSVLFGAHCFFIHPFYVAKAWKQLYGFPWDLRLWLSFFVHDLGYIGKENMDDEEGEKHVLFGAKLMGALFGSEWHDFCLYHSRFYAKKDKAKFSQLCVADKLSFCLTPKWLYMWSVKKSGEIEEYMELAKARTEAGEPKYSGMGVCSSDEEQWYEDVWRYLFEWTMYHKNGKEDTWTPEAE